MSSLPDAATLPSYRRLGDFLLACGYISESQLHDALIEQKRTGRQIGQVLVDDGLLSEEQLAACIARQLGLNYVDLDSCSPSPTAVQLLSELEARRLGAIVLDDSGASVVVGMVDPGNLQAQDQISEQLGRPVTAAVITPVQLREALDKYYPDQQRFEDLAQALEHEAAPDDAIHLGRLSPQGAEHDAPVIKLLQTLFDQADRMRASDIHVEPHERKLLVRFRIDGVLSSQLDADPCVHSALLVRLKLMAGLDIAERRLPQDGRFAVRTALNRIDVRLSTLPTQYGESAVMRLLIQCDRFSDLRLTGMRADTLDPFLRAIMNPHGMVLVTGPTGSGKSTTMYCALHKLNQPEVKILTCEDPIEYRITGVNQVQINEKIGLSFSRALRAFLRQDPDIMLVGEIRDQETAEIAARAAMTGHLVLSTLHTNNAISAAARLFDLGLPAYLIASSLSCIVSQRLIRRVCTHCATEYLPRPDELEWLSECYGVLPAQSRLLAGRGCHHCNGTGYRGRTACHELLGIRPELASALHQGNLELFERLARLQMGTATMGRHAIELALEGQTTLSEVKLVFSTML